MRSAWLARATGIGSDLVARLGREDVTGRFTGIAADGGLQLTLADASVRTIHAGEVFAL